jgi:hypothetical protein
MPYLRYLRLLAHSGVQHITCCVFFVYFSSACVPYVGTCMLHCLFFWNKGLIHTQCQKDTSTKILYHFIFGNRRTLLKVTTF